MHITRIEDSYPAADTFFSEFNLDEWEQKFGELKCSENNINYRHTVLIKK